MKRQVTNFTSINGVELPLCSLVFCFDLLLPLASCLEVSEDTVAAEDKLK